MIGYFPIYASLSREWSWPFKALSFIFYGFGAVTALAGLRNVTNIRFITHVAMGVALAIPAYLLHMWARGTETFWVSVSLRLLALITAGFSLLFILLSIPYLFLGAPEATSQHEVSNTLANEGASHRPQPSKSRFEQVAGIIIATLALLTGLVPLVKAWFNIQ